MKPLQLTSTGRSSACLRRKATLCMLLTSQVQGQVRTSRVLGGSYDKLSRGPGLRGFSSHITHFIHTHKTLHTHDLIAHQILVHITICIPCLPQCCIQIPKRGLACIPTHTYMYTHTHTHTHVHVHVYTQFTCALTHTKGSWAHTPLTACACTSFSSCRITYCIYHMLVLLMSGTTTFAVHY